MKMGEKYNCAEEKPEKYRDAVLIVCTLDRKRQIRGDENGT